MKLPPESRWLIGLFLFIFTPTQVVGQKKPGAPKTVRELQTAIETVLKETGTPAVGVALVHGDSLVWVAGLGRTNLQTNAKATEKTMFRIGSVSKMFVSLAILKLQEEGRVNLKDKVRDRVPEIEFTNPWEKTAPILVEHLLEHTTGWDDLHLTEYALNDPKTTLKQGLDYHPHSRISRWMPGTRMAYCNAGPPVAAYIIEKITGQKFEDYIQEHFFNPMGMENMTYFASEKYRQRGATLYIDNKPQPYWNIIMRPSGSINASPEDMARMLRFFINRGRVDALQLIHEASLKRMETPSTSTGAKAGLEYGYGLANYSVPHKGFVYRSHSGGVNGGLTDFAYLPTHRLGYAVMINSGDGNALSRIATLIRDFQTSHLKADSIRRNRAVHSPGVALSGYYRLINPRIQSSYYSERIISVKHIWNTNNFVFIGGVWGGSPETHMAINDTQYVSKETGKISLVQVNDPLAGEVVHLGSQVLMPVSALIVFGQLFLSIGWLIYLLGSLVFGTIWFIRYWRGRAFSKTSISLGLWPFVASLHFLVAQIVVMIGSTDVFELMGKVSVVSVSLMLLSIGFALTSTWAIINVIIKRNAKINRTIYWQLAILSALHFLVTCYLLSYGQIGVQTWS
ncbi:serine hydrolase domain-containing protein [Larkinella rosea]|uniref:Class A beta-lactamase-related serine hydrolase n=1 Tax=Larkinella rosea TaxID=2025312 RepID=A0A3P1BV47_9BACT|nr:serine hydrolase domain-containing protein [Larkinella rosea]RRB04882.1 class A beta-lactamase-related serine hydrolase [Larkinella rosea]